MTQVLISWKEKKLILIYSIFFTNFSEANICFSMSVAIKRGVGCIQEHQNISVTSEGSKTFDIWPSPFLKLSPTFCSSPSNLKPELDVNHVSFTLSCLKGSLATKFELVIIAATQPGIIFDWQWCFSHKKLSIIFNLFLFLAIKAMNRQSK